MSEDRKPARPRGYLRVLGIAVAFGLTIVACWMVALGHSQKQVSLGVIIGLWAALVGALTLFGGQRHANAVFDRTSAVGTDVDLRHSQELESQREVASRRAYEQQLHEMIRREIDHIQRAMSDQIGQLREDVSGLRGDLVEKVGGQIRLERIETTRVIGSDIEALQNEVRRLAVGRGSGGIQGIGSFPPAISAGNASGAVVIEAASSPRRSADSSHGVGSNGVGSNGVGSNGVGSNGVGSNGMGSNGMGSNGASSNGVGMASSPYVVPPPASAPVIVPASAIAPAPVVAPASVIAPASVVAPAPAVTRTPASAPVPGRPATSASNFGGSSNMHASQPLPPEPLTPPAGSNGAGPTREPISSMGSDPFAGLPRLSPFVDDSPVTVNGVAPAPSQSALPHEALPHEALSHGIAPEPVQPDPVASTVWSSPTTVASDPQLSRRHAADDDQRPAADAPPAVGRRRRADGDSNDILSRLLGPS